jgi:hypothetical protein
MVIDATDWLRQTALRELRELERIGPRAAGSRVAAAVSDDEPPEEPPPPPAKGLSARAPDHSPGTAESYLEYLQGVAARAA